MFTNKEKLIKRTGKNAIDRYDFLKLLATEFKTTKSRGKMCKKVIRLFVIKINTVNSFRRRKRTSIS